MSVSVFAVEDTAIQVCWRGLPAGRHRLVAGPAAVPVEVAEPGAPGAAELTGLAPGDRVEVVLESPGVRPRRVAKVRTLRPPPGPELFRFATVNDLHVGAGAFGHWWPILRDTGAGEPAAERCARAAVAEAARWGARLLVAKGDLTQRGRPWEWDTVARLLADAGIPAVVVPGNHDVRRFGSDGGPFLERVGLELVRSVAHRDVPGLRIVAVDTTIPGSGWGRVANRVDDVVARAREATGPVFVALHHHLQRFRLPMAWPPGVPGPEARALARRLAEANPASFVTSGHTHRHRRGHGWPVTVAEIGSTKDWPGTWAGYAVHEGGLRQVVRRVADPMAIAWTDRTRRAVFGAWAAWSPGLRSHRCFTVTWPTRRRLR